VLSFFWDAVLSIFQVNTGPEYLAGISFSSLEFFDQVLVALLVCAILSVTALYLAGIVKAYIRKDKDPLSHFYMLILLGCLFVLFLAPAVVSIRLEQRWLQASFAILILMLVIILSDWRVKPVYIKRFMIILVPLLFIWTDHNYLSKGGEYLYMAYSEHLTARFKDAMDKGIVRPATRRLYIWEKQRDPNGENAIRWDLGNGYLFEIYQGRAKELLFTDSPYEKTAPVHLASFPDPKDSAEQILYINDSINDITGYFKRDPSK
jgi:hypothetical protein